MGINKSGEGGASLNRICPDKYIEIEAFQEILKHMPSKGNGASVSIQHKASKHLSIALQIKMLRHHDKKLLLFTES